ncbi:MAG TPA: DUF6152 family protein [Gammaproteobacteria bacterium]|nr:DUF6152 family protein [Gammaproteobacteria bacterium]
MTTTMATWFRSAAFGAGLALAGVFGFNGVASAHHSFAPFDMESEKTIEGDIVEFQWTNPHTWTWLNVKNDDGSVTRWGLEGMSPNFLGRRGWTRETLKPGDRVKVVIHPLKNGDPGGTFLRVTLADGTEKVMFGGR